MATSNQFKFDEHPGKINTDTNIYEYDPLIRTDGQVRLYNVFVRVIKQPKEFNTQNWNTSEENVLPMKKEYLTSAIPVECVAQVWTEYGVKDGVITRTAPNYVRKVANKGRANERNVLQSAMVIAHKLWQKNVKNGYQSGKTNLALDDHYFPMLATTYADSKEYLKFPAYVQPKLDGTRCLFFIKKADGDVGDVVAYSRTRTVMPGADFVKPALLECLRKMYRKSSIYLDGELYLHGMKLQDIVGHARADTVVANPLKFYIYDCFYADEIGKKSDRRDASIEEPVEQKARNFESRHELLLEAFKFIKSTPKKTQVVELVPTERIDSFANVETLYKSYIKDGYEGIMIRNKNGLYLASNLKSNQRSVHLMKYKPTFTAEYEIVGFTQGTAKDKGAIIWVCKTENGNEFNVVPKGITYEKRYELYTDCLTNFDKKYKGLQLTCEYQDVSTDNVPLRAKATEIARKS